VLAAGNTERSPENGLSDTSRSGRSVTAQEVLLVSQWIFTAKKMPLNWRFTVGAKDCGSLVSQGPITSAFQITNAVNSVTRDGRRWIIDTHREGRRCIVHSDELLSAFFVLEAMLLWSAATLFGIYEVTH
jgi:hypothetical protein